MAADYLAMGLYERAAAEVSRALARGAPRVDGYTLLGDIYARQGAYGEALERYREAKREAPNTLPSGDRRGERAARDGARRARRGRSPKRCSRRRRAGHRRADARRRGARRHRRSGRGAQRARPGAHDSRRCAPTCTSRSATSRARSATSTARSPAYRHALELDSDFAVVRFQLARLLRAKGMLREAEAGAGGRARRGADVRGGDAGARVAATHVGADRRVARPAHRAAGARSLSLRRAARARRDAARDRPASATRRTRSSASCASIRRHVGALYYDGVLLTEQKRFREAIDRWRRVIELDPSSEFARRARREARTAMDLDAIFAATAAAGLTHGDRGTTSRARHPRRLPAARPEPEDRRAARDVGAARRRGRRAVRRRAR